MKRLVLLLLVFVVAVLAINIYNVKAEEIEAVENENNQTEIAEEEKQEEKKEEVVEVVETPVATESTSNEEAVKTTKGANVKVAAEEKKSCKVTIIFKELSDSGVAINSGNGVNQNLTNTISLNGSASKVSRKLAKTTFTNGNKFTVDGWYSDSELKNPVPETMWYDANTKTRIRVSFTCTEDSPEEVTFTYYLKWNEEKAPIYNFHLYDKHGHRSHDWSNTDGHFGDFSFTFQDPADVETHYSFLYYKDESEDHVYNPKDVYEHNVTNQGANTNVTENFYAWYKADVTLVFAP